MYRLNIRRPLLVVSAAFIVLVWGILILSGGVDEKTYVNDYKKISVTGKIVNKEYKNEKNILHIEKVTSKEESISNFKLMLVYLNNQETVDFKIGQLVEVTGKYQNFKTPQNDGEFNMRRYYRIRGYEGLIVKADIIRASDSYNSYKNYLYEAREKTKRLYFSCMSEEEAGTLSAMVLGDKTNLDSEIKQLYQNAGISHVLSLSGLHIATVGIFIFSLMLRIGFGVRLSSLLSCIIMVSYGVMTGLSTSTVRALIMFFLSLVAKNIGRTYDLLSAVYLSSFLILIENPYLVFDSGYLMSFLAVAGIGMLYPALIGLFSYKNRSLFYKYQSIEKTVQSICISASATLFTLPVVMNSFYKVPIYGVFINLIVVPLMSLILGLGLVSGIIGNVFMKSTLMMFFAKCFLKISDIILKFYTLITEKTTLMPQNLWVCGRAEVWQYIIYALLILSACIYYDSFVKHDNDGMQIKHKVIFTAFIISSLVILSVRHNPEFTINTLSVGQGACYVVYGHNTPTIMLDCGSSDEDEVAKYKIIPFLQYHGIDRIDYLFVSHGDKDHVSGIKEILSMNNKPVKIKKLFLSEYNEELIALADKNNVETHIISKGDYIINNGLLIKCLSPDKSGTQLSENISQGSSENENSLVMELKYDMGNEQFDALFPGDIGAEIEEQLDISKLQFLAVAHHGSKYSSSVKFLEKVSPVISTISAGKNNSYGHPHKETLERLNSCGAKIYRTDENGQITVVIDKGKVFLQKR